MTMVYGLTSPVPRPPPLPSVCLSSVYLCDKISQASTLCECILQVNKYWAQGSPGNETVMEAWD